MIQMSTKKTNKYAILAGYSDMHQQLFMSINGHNVWPLYNRTVLKGILEHSPYLIELKENDSLLTLLPKKHLIIFEASKEYSIDNVLGHLRNRMKINFDGDRKGLLHYYQPNISSYFFSSGVNDTQKWLGIFSSVEWYHQIKTEEVGWRKIENTNCGISNEEWVITNSQIEQLNRHSIDQLISRFYDPEVTLDDHWMKLREACSNCETLNVTDKSQIERYLSIVSTYDEALQLSPQDIKLTTKLSDLQKIDLIQNRFKESIHVS